MKNYNLFYTLLLVLFMANSIIGWIQFIQDEANISAAFGWLCASMWLHDSIRKGDN